MVTAKMNSRQNPCAGSPRLIAHLLPLFGLIANIPRVLAQGGTAVSSSFALVSVQHRPTYGPDVDPSDTTRLDDLPPSRVVQKFLDDTGYSDIYDTHVNFSKRTHVGCYAADFAITEQWEEGVNQDPNECLEVCKKKWPLATTYSIIVAIHKERCGCVLQNFGVFAPADSRLCTSYCKYYQNPICGGSPNYWGVFAEYDYQSLTAHGAFDPWRNIWYTIVAFSDKRLRGGFPTPDSSLPERYFLHAVDVYDGKAQYQYQISLAGILYGLQYDIDSTRLVALHTKSDTGRLRKDMDWNYKLCTIIINTTFETKPDRKSVV